VIFPIFYNYFTVQGRKSCMMCLKKNIINVSLISISNFTNNKLFIVKIYTIKTFVVASAIINRDIFLCKLVCYLYFCTELFIQWYLIIFLKRNIVIVLCSTFSPVSGLQRSPVSIDLLLLIDYFQLYSWYKRLFIFPQTMLKIVKWNIFISLKMFPAGNYFTCSYFFWFFFSLSMYYHD
jgi:hypothetical protein